MVATRMVTFLLPPLCISSGQSTPRVWSCSKQSLFFHHALLAPIFLLTAVLWSRHRSATEQRGKETTEQEQKEHSRAKQQRPSPMANCDNTEAPLQNTLAPRPLRCGPLQGRDQSPICFCFFCPPGTRSGTNGFGMVSSAGVCRARIGHPVAAIMW
jgi:hypothetical protein